MIRTPKTVHEVGPFKAEGVYHGTYQAFDGFSDEYLSSIGFHFGDLKQATYFAGKHGEGGRIIKANLAFNNLVDIGKDDWGWIDCKRGALLCFMQFVKSKIAIDRDEFTKILGSNDWSLAAYPPTQKMNADERRAFANLLRAHDFDGVRYTNNYEPPGKAGGTAYFVLNVAQIAILSSEPVSTPLKA
jgi:hypothetical protein